MTFGNAYSDSRRAQFDNIPGADHQVRLLTDVEDERAVEDVFWLDRDYLDAFRAAGLQILATHCPPATGAEAYPWVNETRTPPWVLYVLGRDDRDP